MFEIVSGHSDEAFETIFSNLTVENGNLVVYECSNNSKFILEIINLEMRNEVCRELLRIDDCIQDIFNNYYR